MIKGLQAQGSEGEIKRGNEAGKERLLTAMGSAAQ